MTCNPTPPGIMMRQHIIRKIRSALEAVGFKTGAFLDNELPQEEDLWGKLNIEIKLLPLGSWPQRTQHDPLWGLLHLPNKTHWADPQDQRACDVEYKLRHHPQTLSTGDMLIAATLINDYRELTKRSGKFAAYIVAAMRRARKPLKLPKSDNHSNDDLNLPHTY